MSFEAMAWAIKQEVGNTTAKFVLLMVANYADEKGRAWPSQERLAEAIEGSRHTVMRALDFLEEAAFLTRIRRHREDGSRSTDVIHLDLSRNLLRCKEGGPKSQIATADPIKNLSDETKGKARARGVRLPEDWMPTPERLAKTEALIGTKATEMEITKFRNYWLSKAGVDATKLDWGRTFDNWIINALERRPSHDRTPQAGSQRPEQPGNLARIFTKINAAIDAAEDGFEGGGGYSASLPAG